MFDLSQIYTNILISIYGGAQVPLFMALLHMVILFAAIALILQLINRLGSRVLRLAPEILRTYLYYLSYLAFVSSFLIIFVGYINFQEHFIECVDTEEVIIESGTPVIARVCRTKNNLANEWSEWDVVNVQLFISPKVTTVDNF